MTAATGAGPAPLWLPDQARQEASHLRHYLDRQGFEDYDAAWRWSVAEPRQPEPSGGRSPTSSPSPGTTRPGLICSAGGDVYGARWFGEGRLNYAERALSPTAATPAGERHDLPPGRRRRHRSVADPSRPWT